MGRVRRNNPYPVNLQVSISVLGNPQRIVTYEEPRFTTRKKANRRRRGGNRIRKNSSGDITRIYNGKISRPKNRRGVKVPDVKLLNAEILNELKTDPEHYKIMRKRWSNLGIPDPAKNLTALRLNGKCVELDDKSKKEKRVYYCTKFHEEKIEKLHDELKKKMIKLHEKEYTEFILNMEKYADELKSASDNGLSLEAILPLFESSVFAFEETFRKYSFEKKNVEESMLAKIKKLEDVKDEIHTFNSFYERRGSNGPNAMYMTESEYSSLHDTERWFAEMKNFYKS